MHIFLCENTIDGMLTGIYDAWASGHGHENVRLELAEDYNMELFCEYIPVSVDSEKAWKVARSIRSKLSEEIYDRCYRALCSQYGDKVDAVYRFLVLAFRTGPSVLQMYGHPAVMRVFELHRYTSDESHLLLGFVRFEEYPNNVLVASIAPNNDVIEILAAHFADRLFGEKWVIYDTRRKRYVMYRQETGLVFGYGALALERYQDRDRYPDLWKAFLENVNIKERYNPKCQMNHLPLRYRPYMTEYQEK